jgi:hypothetical protein
MSNSVGASNDKRDKRKKGRPRLFEAEKIIRIGSCGRIQRHFGSGERISGRSVSAVRRLFGTHVQKLAGTAVKSYTKLIRMSSALEVLFIND